MNLKSWLEKYNCAPIDPGELAVVASKIANDEPLRQAARQFVAAKLALEVELERVGYEFG